MRGESPSGARGRGARCQDVTRGGPRAVSPPSARRPGGRRATSPSGRGKNSGVRGGVWWGRKKTPVAGRALFHPHRPVALGGAGLLPPRGGGRTRVCGAEARKKGSSREKSPPGSGGGVAGRRYSALVAPGRPGAATGKGSGQPTPDPGPRPLGPSGSRSGGQGPELAPASDPSLVRGRMSEPPASAGGETPSGLRAARRGLGLAGGALTGFAAVPQGIAPPASGAATPRRQGSEEPREGGGFGRSSLGVSRVSGPSRATCSSFWGYDRGPWDTHDVC